MASITMQKRKGVSPVIATVLLIAMVIVLALIVFLWFRGLSKESITKFGGTNVELVCNDVSFAQEYVGGILTISNIGNVPIFSFNVKISSQGSHETKELKTLSGNWNPIGLRQGDTFYSEDLSAYLTGASEVVLIPILVGSSKDGDKTHVCEESQGQEVAV